MQYHWTYLEYIRTEDRWEKHIFLGLLAIYPNYRTLVLIYPNYAMYCKAYGTIGQNMVMTKNIVLRVKNSAMDSAEQVDCSCVVRSYFFGDHIIHVNNKIEWHEEDEEHRMKNTYNGQWPQRRIVRTPHKNRLSQN